MTVLHGARVVTPDTVLDPGWVEYAGSRIVGVGRGRRSTGDDLGGAWLVPGFIDVHMHGGGGADVTKSADEMAAAVAFHRGRGTTTTLVSLMAQPVESMCEQLGWAAELYRNGEIAGVHLEGPFLAAARCGAQRPESLLQPDVPVLRKLLDAGQGSVRTVTLAPELPGALELIEELVSGGVIPAVGHTDADYAEATAGFGAGARLATHLFNAMGSISQRAPGPSIAALDSGAFVELINDGVHVHDALIRLVARSSPHALAFITDAISATGVGDGTYTLGEQLVQVHDGRATLGTTGRLAGSTLTMDVALQRGVRALGLPIEIASRASAGNAARLLGIGDRVGSISAGTDANIVVLDDALVPQRVLFRGEWL